MSQLRVAVIGGGSGGHLFPAIAVVQEILKQHPDTAALFLTSRRPIDAHVLASVGWPTTAPDPADSGMASRPVAGRVAVEPYIAIPRSHGNLSRLAMLPGVSRAYLRARKRLQSFAPHLVIGCGAMASLPGVYAAHRRHIPITLMEQNVVPGQAIRMLARFAILTQAGLPFLSEYSERWPGEILVTGTPVRAAIAELAASDRRQDHGSRPKLLILGGSQGSRSVNRLTLEALADERLIPSDWEIVHQTGEAHVAEVAAEYARHGRMASVRSFLPDLPQQLATATIAISRAGAGTLQELSCAGVPSILIPFSHAANDHQQSNATCLAERRAAIMIDEQTEDAGSQLRTLLMELISSSTQRDRLSAGIREFARPTAARDFATRLLHLSVGSP
ncbi:MAG: UDP-N-acetylglucosamine--N-acetylmuramyl-(pentapeptide) pyrophosphoryl-undecaprenol N-acetylglucosamine transferase [Planctomycetota bacterium]